MRVTLMLPTAILNVQTEADVTELREYVSVKMALKGALVIEVRKSFRFTPLLI